MSDWGRFVKEHSSDVYRTLQECYVSNVTASYSNLLNTLLTVVILFIYFYFFCGLKKHFQSRNLCVKIVMTESVVGTAVDVA